MKKLDKGGMTVREMGKLGGLARAAKCTPQELSAIGCLGIAAAMAKYTPQERRQYILRGGRPSPQLTEKKIARIKKLFKSGWPQARIARALGVSRPTVRRHLGRYRRRKAVRGNQHWS